MNSFCRRTVAKIFFFAVFYELLTNLSTMFNFCTPWKRQKTGVFRGWWNGILAWNGLKILCESLDWDRSLQPEETNLSLNYPFLADNCFFDRGQYYRGIRNVTTKNNACLYWRYTKEGNFGELSSHNFCRNPGAKRDRPWCYVNGGYDRKFIEYCDIPSCCKLRI